MKMGNRAAKPKRRYKIGVFNILVIVAAVAFSFRLANVVTFLPQTASDEVGIVMAAGAQQHTVVENERPPPFPAGTEQAGYIEEEDVMEEAPPAALPGVFSDTAFSDAEIEILQTLSHRREALDRRERHLQEKEALLQAAEQEVEKKIEELDGLRQEIEALLGQQQKDQEARISSLVRIYENMKPKEAARIFDTLEMDVLLPVIGQMNERRSSPIIANMDPEKARLITRRLMEQRSLPQMEP